MKKESRTKIIFYSLIGNFLVLLFYFLPIFDIGEKRWFFPILAVLALLFLILGILLIIFSGKESKKLKIFLRITGIAAISPLPFTILHNFFYALGEMFQNFKILFEILHAASFLIALIVAPLMFLIGAIGSIILFNKSKSK